MAFGDSGLGEADDDHNEDTPEQGSLRPARHQNQQAKKKGWDRKRENVTLWAVLGCENPKTRPIGSCDQLP